MKRLIKVGKFFWRQRPTTGTGWWYLGLFVTAIVWCIFAGVMNVSPSRFLMGIGLFVIVSGLVHRWPNMRSHEDEEGGWKFNVTADAVSHERDPNTPQEAARNRREFEKTASELASKRTNKDRETHYRSPKS